MTTIRTTPLLVAVAKAYHTQAALPGVRLYHLDKTLALAIDSVELLASNFGAPFNQKIALSSLMRTITNNLMIEMRPVKVRADVDSIVTVLRVGVVDDEEGEWSTRPGETKDFNLDQMLEAVQFFDEATVTFSR